MTCALTARALGVSLEATESIAPEAREYAREQLTTLAFGAPVAVQSASLELLAADLGEGARAKARLDLGTHVARVDVAGDDPHNAVDRATARLRRQLTAMRERPLTAGPCARRDGGWRFGNEPTDRPRYTVRPVAERALVRHKIYDAATRTPEEAITAAALLDYDFFLFVNRQTRRPSVVRRTPGGIWQLAEAARCSVSDAVEMLDVSGARFVFFQATPAGALHALYRRYDGNYGLLSPEA
jgi:ribosome-associated translation inhibitor RaiA